MLDRAKALGIEDLVTEVHPAEIRISVGTVEVRLFESRNMCVELEGPLWLLPNDYDAWKKVALAIDAWMEGAS